ncbi:MAG: alkaline phosphatase family protein, partial [Ignavibacteria bacterium]
MKSKLFILILYFSLYLPAQNVIVVVIDGGRYSETFGGSAEYIPHLYHDLAPSGAIFTNFRISDEGMTSTNPGQASILTGNWQLMANDGSERPRQPTAFEYYRKELSACATDCFIVAGKKKIHALSYSTFPGYGSEFGASTNCFDGKDDEVYDSLVVTMDTYHPKLILVNFPTTDINGHSGIWNDYVKALKNVDNLIFKLWQKIQNDPYYQNTTTMFVTNDHGRHTNDFKDHGCSCDGCEHIMLLAVGRNVKPGVENGDLHYQIDIGPTIG